MTSLCLPVSLSQFGPNGATLPRTLRPLFGRREAIYESSTLGIRHQKPHWFAEVSGRILDMGKGADLLDQSALKECLTFLSLLPETMPKPFAAIGDDGSVGVEWEEQQGHLYLSFSSQGDEAYWCSPSGIEWEGVLGSTIPLLVDAMFELMKRED